MKSLMLVCGASELGIAIASRFAKYKSHWKTLSIDTTTNPPTDHNLSFKWSEPIESQLESAYSSIQSFSPKYHCIISAGHLFEPTKFKDPKIFNSMSNLNQLCMLPALVSSHLAVKYLEKEGILMFRGSYQVLKDKYHEHFAYGTALNMVHGIGDYMANSKEMPEGSRVLTVAPDFALLGETDRKPDKILKPESVAEHIFMWANAEAGVPSNGSFVGITGTNGVAVPEIL